MKQSFTYYITLAVIKLKGLKRKFSQDPIDYDVIRIDDVCHPTGKFFKKYITNSFRILNSSITEVKYNRNTDKLLLFIHGGAFISGPGQHHWDTVKTLAKETGYTIWMCNYPKAPEYKISEISQNIDAIYKVALGYYQPNKIICIGDSVGGTLITAMVQRLIAKNESVPNKLVLVSPVMDASFSNSEIDKIDLIDPMLSKKGLLSAKKMCAGNYDLKEPIISPIYGSFDGFPETVIYVAEKDITYPDQILAYKKIQKANVDIKLIEGKNMPHIWPFLPIMKEAQIALNQIIENLNQSYIPFKMTDFKSKKD